MGNINVKKKADIDAEKLKEKKEKEKKKQAKIDEYNKLLDKVKDIKSLKNNFAELIKLATEYNKVK